MGRLVAVNHLAAALAALSALFAVTAIALRDDRLVIQRLAGFGSQTAPRARVPTTILARIARLGWVRRIPLSTRVPALLATADWSVDPARFRAAKVLSASVAVGTALAGSALIPVLSAIAPLIGVASFRAPDVWLARVARRRRSRADLELPQFLDLLAAASTAGLGPHGALRRAAGATSGPLRRELERFLDAVDLGARWREELDALGERLGLADLRRAVHAMVRTERLGSSLSEALRELADDVRDERRGRGNEAARKAPIKMLFPLVFMVLPAFLLLTVVPVLIATVRSLR
jgi:tight adherence protein C